MWHMMEMIEGSEERGHEGATLFTIDEYCLLS